MKTFSMKLSCEDTTVERKYLHEGNFILTDDGVMKGVLVCEKGYVVGSSTRHWEPKKSYVIGRCDLEAEKMIFIQFYGEKLEYPFPNIYCFNQFNLPGFWDYYEYLYGKFMSTDRDGQFDPATVCIEENAEAQLSKAEMQMIDKIHLQNKGLVNMYTQNFKFVFSR